MLKNVFEDIITNKKQWLQCREGSEFEDRFESSLKQWGFARMLLSDFNRYSSKARKKIKNQIQDKRAEGLVENIFYEYPEMQNCFIHQPYGSQNFPDFLIFTKMNVLAIEIKYSKNKANKPMWNSNLPKANAVYIFGAYGKQDVTFFLGKDVLPEKERAVMLDFFDRVKSEEAAFKSKMKDLLQNDEIENERGFSVYVRRAFDQSKTINSKSNIDYFNHPNKIECEHNVISFLRNIES